MQNGENLHNTRETHLQDSPPNFALKQHEKQADKGRKESSVHWTGWELWNFRQCLVSYPTITIIQGTFFSCSTFGFDLYLSIKLLVLHVLESRVCDQKYIQRSSPLSWLSGIAEGDFVWITVSVCISPGFKLSLHPCFSLWIPVLAEGTEVHCTAPSCIGTTMNINRWAPQGITTHPCLAAGWECQYRHNTGIVISLSF